MRTSRVFSLCLIAFALTACGQQSNKTKVPAPNRGVPAATDGVASSHLHREEVKQLMPLTVGNRWTYRWTSPAAQCDAEVSDDEVIFYGQQISSYQGKGMEALALHRDARQHRETYAITRQDGGRYSFEISSTPDVSPDQIRDGRYDDSKEYSWSWVDQEKTLVLLEGITRNWNYPSRQYLLQGGVGEPPDLPTDEREVIRLGSKDGTGYRGRERVWSGSSSSGEKTMCAVTQYNSRSQQVVVPAGKFSGCFETVVKFFMSEEKIDDSAWGALYDRTDGPLLYETHTFWAPGVGMVREYQKLGNGQIAYELALIEYDLRGGNEGPVARDSVEVSEQHDGTSSGVASKSPRSSAKVEAVGDPVTPAPPAADAGEVWKFDEQPVPVRLRMPPTALQPWKTHSCPQNDTVGTTIASYGWCEVGKEAEIALKYHVVPEVGRKRTSANAYLPLEAGRQWVYRRSVWATMAVLAKDKQAGGLVETLTRNPCYWRSGSLSNGNAIEERGCLKIVVDTIRRSAGDRGDLHCVDEYTIALKGTVAYGNETALVVEAFPEASVRDGRYGRKSFGHTLWLQRQGEAGTEFKEVTFWTTPPSNSEKVACERAILFDTGLSQVRTYGSADRPSDEVIHGLLVEEGSDLVEVPAGEFADTLRVIDYLQPRGAGKQGLSRPTELPSNHMDYGWITISWYARGVGLIKEVQYLKSGAPCYTLELISTPFDPSYQ